ncbi:hypothetical protein RHMOL_Rhmol03G0296500 [Rhododendron molle]|uniref:Uncharacterized protein n=1 Tax=Rhododendron molle TaxID=49168 RepID=A0ACC0PLA2_RHOML|nr:hypothetical protein RHMOL_Rhmol03G0296500 [Rhododendron molle]
MGMTTNKSFNLPFLLSLSQLIVIIITLLNLYPVFVHALNIGIPEDEECSRTCESQNCGDDYLNTVCSQNFLRCVNKFKRRRRTPFKGNTCSIDQVTNVMTTAMNFALIAGKFVNKS